MNEFKLEIQRNVKAVNPLTYIETIKHINNSEIVLTDSGGLQKEAYYCHKPVIVLRNETEWIELIDNNYSIYFRDYKKDHKFNTDYENLYYVNTNNIQIIRIAILMKVLHIFKADHNYSSRIFNQINIDEGDVISTTSFPKLTFRNLYYQMPQ